MKPDRIRKLDRYLGIPLCLALTLFDRLTARFGAPPAEPPVPGKILFFKLTEQGASVLAHAAVARAERIVGRANVYFCVFEENRPILDIMDLVPPENVFALRHGSLVRFCLDMLGFLLKARRLGIDTVIDMEFFSRASAAAAYLSGARTRVGCHRYSADLPYRGDLMTHRVQYNPYLHVVRQYDLLVQTARESRSVCPLPKMLYDEALPPVPSVRPAEAVFAAVRSTLRELGVEGHRPIVLLNPNASDMLPIRKWETKRFVELAQRLLEGDDRLVVLFTGAPSERSACEAIAAAVNSPRAASVAGRTTLEQLIALYWMADVLVTNDSGPAHFASLTDIKVVVLFGPETPLLFGPLGTNATVIRKPLACSPCVSVFNHRHTPCTDNLCMQLIGVDEVLERIQALVSAR